MKFPLGLLMCGIGACLLYVAARGVEVASGKGVYQALINGMAGESRTESGPGEMAPDSEERPNTGDEGNLDGLVGMER